MKCEYCNGTLSLEDKNCPHCGRPNEHAKQHIRDMEHYKGEFEDTKQFVKEKTVRYTQYTVRIAIIAILLIIALAGILVAGRSWEITRQMRVSKANKNFEQYSKIIDDYLEHEEYLKIQAFADAKSIRYYDSPYEGKYAAYLQLCNRYSDTYYALYRLVGINGYDNLSSSIGIVEDNLKSFYRFSRDLEGSYLFPSGEDIPEEYTKACAVMERNIELILINYLGFTEEEAISLPNLSEGRRRVLFEDKLEEMLQNEE